MNQRTLLKRIQSLPPGLTITQATQRLGVPYQSARRLILAAGYPFRDGRRLSQRATRILDPEKVDWRKSNIQIARELLISRERVRAVRFQLGKPFVESRGRPPKGECSCGKHNRECGSCKGNPLRTSTSPQLGTRQLRGKRVKSRP